MFDSRDNKDCGDFRAFQDYETPRDDASPTPQNPQTDESAPPAESTRTSQNAPPSARRDEPGVFAQILFYSVKYGLILTIFGGGGLCRLATEDSDRYDRVDRPPVPRIADVPPKRTERDASSTSENAPSAPSVPDDLPERLEIARRLSAPIVDGKPDVDAIRNGVLRRLIVEKGDEAPRWSSRGLKLRAPQDANWNDDAERPGGTLQTLTLCDRRDSSRDVELRFRWIPAGAFLYGSPLAESDRDESEVVPHQTTVERGFWLLETETTEKIVFRLECSPRRLAASAQNSLLKTLGSVARPLIFALPARVDAEEARRFCERLNSLEGKPDGFAFRLPTEAEWERACRAGTTTPFNVGEEPTFRDAVFAEPDVSYQPDGSGNVGLFKPNAWGLYDMHGNLAEWTTAVENAPNSPNADDSDASPTFVLRGGSFNSTASDCASSAREVVASSAGWRKGQNAGFRIALAPVDEPDETSETADAENQPVETPQVADAENETNETPQVADAENEPNETPQVAVAENETNETPESAPVAE